MDKIISAGIKDYNILTFSWFVINTCQFRCKYCSVLEDLPLVKKANPVHLKNYKQILKILKLKILPQYKIELQGGEPTLHPNFFNIIERLNEYNNNTQTEIITNLHKPLDFYSKLDRKKYNKVFLTTSFHPQYHNVEKYFEKVKEINKYENISIRPNINLSDNKEYWEMTIQLMDLFIKNNINFGTNKLFNAHKYITNYDDSFNEKFNYYIERTIGEGVNGKKIPYKYDNGSVKYYNEYEVSKNNLNKFIKYKCVPKYWVINYNNEIYNSCTGEKFDIVNRNWSKCVSCSVCTGCLEEEKYFYYKELDE